MSILELEKEILNMDLENKLYLANSLFADIENMGMPDYENEWLDLAERRLDSIKIGESELVDSETVLKMIEDNY